MIALDAWPRGALGLAAAIALACSGRASAQDGEPLLEAVQPADLCLTLGEVHAVGENRMEVAAPALRAVVPASVRSVAEMDFRYEGPTDQSMALASGEMRRQIGLKLRASDSCNVLYVMWQIEPHPGLAVSLKSNPGKRTHEECGDRGYRHLTPEDSRPMPELRTGEPHVLRADLAEDHLRVFVDRELAWDGKLPAEALAFDGPVGIRTDNGRFEFRLAAVQRRSWWRGFFGATCWGYGPG